MSAAPEIELRIRSALHYLERASDSWRGRDPHSGQPLHWPLAVDHAKRALGAALGALESHECPSAATATPATSATRAPLRPSADPIRHYFTDAPSSIGEPVLGAEKGRSA